MPITLTDAGANLIKHKLATQQLIDATTKQTTITGIAKKHNNLLCLLQRLGCRPLSNANVHFPKNV
jgi:hypothetical protein